MKTVGSNLLLKIIIKKGKVLPVHAKKAYKGSRGMAPLILYLDTIWR
jgi:hypothetical protein